MKNSEAVSNFNKTVLNLKNKLENMMTSFSIREATTDKFIEK